MIINGNGTDITAAALAAWVNEPTVVLEGQCLTTGLTIPAGKHLRLAYGAVLQGTINIGGDNILIDGEGTVDAQNSSWHAINHTGQNNVTIKGISIRNTQGCGIMLNDGSFLIIEDVKIKDVQLMCIGYYFMGSSNPAQPSDLIIRNCRLDKRSTTHDLAGTYAAILSYGGTGNRTLTNVTVEGNTVTGKGFGSGNGIEFLSSNTTYPNHINMQFNNNTISYCSLGLTGGNAPNVTMNSNTIFGCHGMAIEISAWGASVTGNSIDCQNKGGGILADGGFTGTFGTGIVITGNTITNSMGAALQTSGMISGVIFANNYMRVGGGRGIFPQGTSPANMFITGNFFDGATVGNIAIDMPAGNHPFYIVNNKFMRWTTANINGSTAADTTTGNF